MPPPRRFHVESAAPIGAHRDHLLSETNVEGVLADEALHEFEEVLLRVLLARQPAVKRDLHRLDQHELPSRVVQERAAQRLLLLDHAVAETVLHRGEGGDQARWAGPHDQQVHRLALGARDVALGDPLHRLASLLDRVADEREAARLPHHEEAGHAALAEPVEPGHVVSAAQVAQADLDRPHRARGLAAPVPDAAQSVDDGGGAPHDTQDVPLGTRVHAGATADAVRGVDQRVLSGRAIDPQRLRLLLALAVACTVAPVAQRVRDDDRRDERRYRGPDGHVLGYQNRYPVSRPRRGPCRSSPCAYSSSRRTKAWRPRAPRP